MAEDWIMVRLRRATHAELDRVRQSMCLAHEVGLRQLELDDRDRVSLDQVIRLLIQLRDKHAERRRRSAAKRKRKRDDGMVCVDLGGGGLLRTTPEEAQRLVELRRELECSESPSDC